MSGNNINFIIFGGTGDLSYRKLMPVFYNIYASDKTKKINIISIGRREYTKEDYIDIIKPWVNKYSRVEYDEDTFNEFTKNVSYCKCDFTNIDEYVKLENHMSDKVATENIFYFAVAPRFFSIIGEGIAKIKYAGDSKIIIEKPFGETLEEADKLNAQLEKSFSKKNIYHIDHYLGKEMVQNLLALRFSNIIFENSWNKESIENIKIIASEEEGVGTRAGYYDQSGAVKDMLQNHLMQILSIVAMEAPENDNCIKENQVEVLKQLRKTEDLDAKNHLLLGQYDGYLSELNVKEDSKTETLAFAKLYIDNKRWENVPFYLITGKALSKRELRIEINFKSVRGNEKNKLVFKVQPNESMIMTFNTKKPGNSHKDISMNMSFEQSTIPGYKENMQEAYEKLIIDSIENNHIWFANWEQIHTAWTYIEALKNKYDKEELGLMKYEQGTSEFEALEEIGNN